MSNREPELYTQKDRDDLIWGIERLVGSMGSRALSADKIKGLDFGGLAKCRIHRDDTPVAEDIERYEVDSLGDLFDVLDDDEFDDDDENDDDDEGRIINLF